MHDRIRHRENAAVGGDRPRTTANRTMSVVVVDSNEYRRIHPFDESESSTREGQIACVELIHADHTKAHNGSRVF